MIKNKSFYIPILFFIIISALLIPIFIKYSPFLFRTPVYYCQHALCSTLLKISGVIGTTLFKILLVTIVITFTKSVLDFFKIISLRRSLKPVNISGRQLKGIIRELDLENKIVAVEHREPFAFCLGIFRSKIVVSRSLIKILSLNELKAVLYHEKYHLEHRDALTMYITRFSRSLFPFFPLLSDQTSFFSLDREIKADKYAISELRDNRFLIAALKKLISFTVIPAFSTFPSFFDSDKNLELRINALLHKNINYSAYSRKNILLSLCALAVFSGLIYLPISTVNINTPNTREVVACLSDNACVQACKEEKGGTDSLFTKLHLTPKQ